MVELINASENTKIDTEIRIYKAKNGDEIFVKHSGFNTPSIPNIQEIIINYNNGTNILSWTQIIINEIFEYYIYYDKIDLIRNQNYTLCDAIELKNLSHKEIVLTNDSTTPNITFNFLEFDLDEFDIFNSLYIQSLNILT